MIFKLTLNGVKVEKDIPTSWEQVKFKDFLQLNGSVSKALSIFTGIDEDTLKKANITGLDKLISVLSFLGTDVPLFNFPKKLLNEYDVPYDIGFESWGQYVDLKDELDKRKEGIELLKQYPLFCAIYTMKDYNFKLAEQRAEHLLNAPCTEVMAVGNFMLTKLAALNLTTKGNSLPEGTVLRKYRLALKGWWTNMVFTVRFYILKRKLRLTEKS
jgi:hypothetical protein